MVAKGLFRFCRSRKFKARLLEAFPQAWTSSSQPQKHSCVPGTGSLNRGRSEGPRLCISNLRLPGGSRSAALPTHTSSSRNRKLYPFPRFGTCSYMIVTFLLTFLFQSLDYDRCINDPYLEVLETMDNKVSPLLTSWHWIDLTAASFSHRNAPVDSLTPWLLPLSGDISVYSTTEFGCGAPLPVHLAQALRAHPSGILKHLPY